MILFRSPFTILVTLLLVASPLRGQGAGDVLRLRPGDAVRLEVGDEPELGGQFIVGEDGRLLLPLVGFVSAAELPFEEVRGAVRRAYQAEVKDASVALTPIVRVAVLGEVRASGLVLADPTFTLAEILASAGGITVEADPQRVSVTRAGGTLPFSLEDASADGYRVRSGDQIVVGRRSWISLNQGLLLSAGASIVTAAVTALLLR